MNIEFFYYGWKIHHINSYDFSVKLLLYNEEGNE